MKKIKKQSKINIVFIMLYIVLISLLIFNGLNISNSYRKFEDNHIKTIEKEISDVIENNSDPKTIASKLEKLTKDYLLEISLTKDNKDIYSSISFGPSYNKMNNINPQALLFEAQGEIRGYDLWYAIYSPNSSDFSSEFLVSQLGISILSLLLISFMFFNTRKQMIKPLEQIKESINSIKVYNFEGVKSSEDVINKEFYEFSSSLEKTIDNVSRSYTHLEIELKEQEERLSNIITFSKSLVHNLKTPAHQLILRSQHSLNKPDESNEQLRETLSTNIKVSEKIITQINQILDILKKDDNNYLSNIESVDVSRLFHETVRTFENEMRLKNNFPNLILEDDVTVSTNYASLQILLFNLVSNTVTYSPEESEISFVVKSQDDSVIIETINEASEEDINRIKKSEHLFSNLEPSTTNKYSSGVGMFIIKEMIANLCGEYNLFVEDSTIRIQAIIPKDSGRYEA